MQAAETLKQKDLEAPMPSGGTAYPTKGRAFVRFSPGLLLASLECMVAVVAVLRSSLHCPKGLPERSRGPCESIHPSLSS